jgi:hypothetical protein
MRVCRIVSWIASRDGLLHFVVIDGVRVDDPFLVAMQLYLEYCGVASDV